MPDVAALGRTLCVWAHPDDETYLAGGLMPALVDAGCRVVCVTATRGEAGELPGAEGLPAARVRAALAATRTRELLAALDALGVAEHHWLDLPDGGCAGVDPDRATARLLAIAADVRPDTVVGFGPDGFTGHPDHRAVAAWTARAVAALAPARPRVLHAVCTPEQRAAGRDVDDRFDVYALGEPRLCRRADLAVHLELTSELLARKVTALRAQRSQTGPLLAAIGRHRFAAWVRTESFAVPARRGGGGQ